MDDKKEQPYDTTYGKDYSTDAKATSTSILRTTSTKKLNEAKRNKSVKFSESVTFSNGYQTSSSFVNDIGKERNNQQCVQSLKKSLPTTASITERPLTAPGLQRQSILKTTPLLFPASPQTQPYLNGLQSRPSSTGTFGAVRNDLRCLQDTYSKSATHKKFNSEFPENAPDIRRTPDMRITINERRHVIPEIGCHSYYFHG